MRGPRDLVPLPVRRVVLRVLPETVRNRVRPLAHGESAAHDLARRGRRLSMRLSSGRSVPAGTTAVTLRGVAYLAVEVDTFRAENVLARNLGLVADVLEAAGIPYFLLDAGSPEPWVVVVSVEHRADVLRALSRELACSPTYVAVVKDRRAGSAHLLRGRAWGVPPRVTRVFQVMAARGGGALSGPELGCDLEFWDVERQDRPPVPGGESRPAGTLVAPRRNRWTDLVTPSESATETRVVAGVPRPVLSSLRRPHVFTVREPIDAVYTWVDGSDPEWAQRKLRAQTDLSRAELHSLAANQSRFVSRDELRYSLRSLEMYANWVRNIYLVTDDQLPTWLDIGNPRIQIISHRRLFGDRGRLPTFNSHAIESQLHHIDGLSEQFLYLNDDVFFGRPVAPTLFFQSNGLTVFHLSSAKIGLGPAGDEDVPVMSAAKNNRDLLGERFGCAVTSKLQHVPHPVSRSVMHDLEQDFHGAVARTARSQFRSSADVSTAASLVHHYAYLTGRAVPAEMAYFYADIAREDTPVRLRALTSRRDVDCFCLNDHDSRSVDPQRQARMVDDFLSSYFPIASSFERCLEPEPITMPPRKSGPTH